MEFNEGRGLYTLNLASNQKLIKKDLDGLAYSKYKNACFHLTAIAQRGLIVNNRLAATKSVCFSGVHSIPAINGLTINISAGCVMGFTGRYVSRDLWKFMEVIGESFFVIITNTSASFNTADPVNDRYDTVQVRPVIVTANAKERRFLDPYSLTIANTTVDTKQSVSFEISVIPGIPGSGVAPDTTAGYVKIAEVCVLAAATSLSAACVNSIRETRKWTTEANSIYYLNDLILNEHARSSFQQRYNRLRFLNFIESEVPSMSTLVGLTPRTIAYSKKFNMYLSTFVSSVSNQGVIRSSNLMVWEVDHTNTPTPSVDTYGLVFWSDIFEIYIAAGVGGTSGTIHTSPDGITWTSRLSITVDAGSTPSDLIYYERDSKFVCGFAISGNVDIYTSVNGTTWVEEATDVAATDGHSRIAVNKRTGICVCLGVNSAGADGLAYSNTNISAWSDISSSLPVAAQFDVSATAVEYGDIAYNKYLDMFVIVGTYTVASARYNMAIHSYDGINWEISELSASAIAHTTNNPRVFPLDGGFIYMAAVQAPTYTYCVVYKTHNGRVWQDVTDDVQAKVECQHGSTNSNTVGFMSVQNDHGMLLAVLAAKLNLRYGFFF